jgi:hypothetical protein
MTASQAVKPRSIGTWVDVLQVHRPTHPNNRIRTGYRSIGARRHKPRDTSQYETSREAASKRVQE